MSMAVLQAMFKPFKWLRITPGFRADQVGGDFTNLATGKAFDVNNYGTIWQPKIGVVITPIDGYSLYGNWGRTFQVGIGAATYKTNPNPIDVAPSINYGWEIGTKIQPTDWAEARIDYWKQSATNESSRVLNNANNDSVLIGAADQLGVEVKVSPIKSVSLYGFRVSSHQTSRFAVTS